MKAAVLTALHAAPLVQEFEEPRERRDSRVIRVTAGGGSPTELMRAAGVYGAFNPPCVVGGEGGVTSVPEAHTSLRARNVESACDST